MAAGYKHSCGVRSVDGHAVCWGDNTNGGATPPSPGEAIVVIAAGNENSVAIRSSDGKPLCVCCFAHRRNRRLYLPQTSADD